MATTATTLATFGPAAAAAAVLALLWPLVRRVLEPDPLDILPGPPRKSFWSGNLSQLFHPTGWSFHAALTDSYGRAVRLASLPFFRPRLYLSDPRAIHDIVHEETTFVRTAFFERINLMCFGPGLVAVDGEQHRRQRRMMQPVFGHDEVKRLKTVFADVAHELVNAIRARLPDASSADATAEIDMLRVAKRAALEYIVRAGLGNGFGALDASGGLDLDAESLPDGKEVTERETEARAYNAAVRDFAPTLFSLSIMRQFLSLFPPSLVLGPPPIRALLRLGAQMLALVDKNVHRLIEITSVMDRTARGVIRRARSRAVSGVETEHGGTRRGRDIISVLLRANTASTEKDRLSDDELVAQMGILIFAGHETTAIALCRALHALALRPRVQARIRREARHALGLGLGSEADVQEAGAGACRCCGASDDDGRENEDEDEHHDGDGDHDPASDRDTDLDAVKYLDAVVRETLRLYPPVYMVHRTVTRNTILQLEHPVPVLPQPGLFSRLRALIGITSLSSSLKPSVNANVTSKPDTEPGTGMTTSLPLRAGTEITLALAAVNRDPSVWGTDAHRWRPGRWLRDRKPSRGPGVYSGMMTFLDGRRSCIGFCFAVLEMKFILAHLLAHFVFAPPNTPDPNTASRCSDAARSRLRWRLGAIVAPGVEGPGRGGPQLPLRVRLVRPDDLIVGGDDDDGWEDEDADEETEMEY